MPNRSRGRDSAGPRSMRSLLDSIRRDPAIREGMERARLLDSFPAIADIVLGADGSENCRAIQLSDRNLVVEVTDNIWAQRVQMSAREILKELQARGGSPRLARLNTRVRQRRAPEPAATSAPPEGPAMRCERCGGRSAGERLCLACAAELDYWRDPPP